MKLYAPGSFSGNYIPQGDTADADCVISNEFGYRVDEPGLVNERLANLIAKNYAHLPLLLGWRIAEALRDIDQKVKPARIFEGDSVNYTGTHGIGTAGELRQAKKFMEDNKLERAVLVDQAYHV